MQNAECRVKENFLTAFENYLIKMLFELAKKATSTLHSALLTLH